MNCSGGLVECDQEAEWVNANDVKVCDWHKNLIDAFTWENRNQRTWEKIE